MKEVMWPLGDEEGTFDFSGEYQTSGRVMSANSTIEWTDATWNPVRGCTKISPGCKHCYAETFAERFRGVKGHPYEQGFDLRLVPFFLHRSRPRPTLAAYDHPIHPPQIYLTSVQTAQ